MTIEFAKESIVDIARAGNIKTAIAMFLFLRDTLTIGEEAELAYEIDTAALQYVDERR